MNKTAIIYCDECKHKFSMNSVNINETTIEIGRYKLKLAYFACPKCNKIYRIALMDERYAELKKDFELIKTKMIRAINCGNVELVRALNNLMIKKRQRLGKHLENLNNKFSGTFTFEVSKNNQNQKEIKYLP